MRARDWNVELNGDGKTRYDGFGDGTIGGGDGDGMPYYVEGTCESTSYWYEEDEVV